MNTDKLAKVFFDNQPIELADARPKVAAILFASGKPKDTSVQWLRSRSDPKGKIMRPEEVVDRTAEPTTPIYLTSADGGRFDRSANAGEHAGAAVAPVPASGSAPARQEPAGTSDTQSVQVAKPDAAREPPARQNEPRDPAREQEPRDPARENEPRDPARRRGPRADAPARRDDAAADRAD